MSFTDELKLYFGLVMQYPISVFVSLTLYFVLGGKSFISLTDNLENNTIWIKIATLIYILVCLEAIWRILYFNFPEGISVLKFAVLTASMVFLLEYGIMTLWRILIRLAWDLFRKIALPYYVDFYNQYGKTYLDTVMMSISVLLVYFADTFGSVRREIASRIDEYIFEDTRCLDCGVSWRKHRSTSGARSRRCR